MVQGELRFLELSGIVFPNMFNPQLVESLNVSPWIWRADYIVKGQVTILEMLSPRKIIVTIWK